ncbi:MAG TPA: hypothetical protein VGR35_12630 [Tepidisphaeraceae bacterium]|nr:hypothetical protein [Tepidisphaeraceae bacterium]
MIVHQLHPLEGIGFGRSLQALPAPAGERAHRLDVMVRGGDPEVVAGRALPVEPLLEALGVEVFPEVESAALQRGIDPTRRQENVARCIAIGQQALKIPALIRRHVVQLRVQSPHLSLRLQELVPIAMKKLRLLSKSGLRPNLPKEQLGQRPAAHHGGVGQAMMNQTSE